MTIRFFFRSLLIGLFFAPLDALNTHHKTKIQKQAPCPFYAYMTQLFEIKCALMADPSLCPTLSKELKKLKKAWLCEMRSYIGSVPTIDTRTQKAMKTVQMMIAVIENDLQSSVRLTVPYPALNTRVS